MNLKKKSLFDIYFDFFLVAIILNLNGMFLIFFGINALFSPLLLLVSLHGIVIALKKNIRLNNSMLNLYFFAIVLYLIISSASSFKTITEIEYYNYISYLANIPIMLFLFSYCSYYISKFGFEKLLKKVYSFFLINLFLVSIIYFFDFDFHPSKDYLKTFRFSGNFANPNELASFSIFTIILTFYNANIKKLNLIFSIIIISISFYFILISFSRSGIIFALVLILFSLLQISSKRNFFFSILFFSLSLLVYNLFFESFINNLSLSQQYRLQPILNIFETGITNELSTGRFEYWIIAQDKIISSPLFGSGFGSFHRISEIGLGVHNTYLMIIGESGIFPFFLLIIFLTLLFVRIIKIKSKLKFFSLWVFLVISVLIFGSIHDALSERITSLFFVLLIIISGLKNYKNIS